MAWQSNLRPASFRGVAFLWDGHELAGGRRLAEFEFPLRDQPFLEDLGRRLRRYSLIGYVLGDDYFAQRDALLQALEQQDTAGTLVHPYLGTVQVRPLDFRLRESQAEGRLARFQMEFVEDGPLPSPVTAVDTAGAVNARAGGV